MTEPITCQNSPYQLFDLAFEAIAVFDFNGKIIYSNNSFCSIFSMNNTEDNCTFEHFFTSHQTFENIIHQIKENKTFQLQVESKQGKCYKINALENSETETITFYFIETEQLSEKVFDLNSLNAVSLVEEAADSFFIINEKLEFIGVNNSACKLTGYFKEELLKLNYTNLFSENELQNKPFDIKGINEGKTIVNERILLRKDLREVDIEMRTKKLSNGSILSIVRDISSRVEIRNKLEQTYQQVIASENRYKQLFKNLPLGIFTATEKGTIESINNQMLEILGSNSVHKTLQLNLFELPTLKNTKLLEDLKSALFEGRSHFKLYEYTSIWKKRIYIRTHILPLEKETINRILVIVEDFTQERDNEMRMKILSQGVKNSPASIIVTNSSGQIIYANKRCIEVTGYSLDELLQNTPSVLKSGHHKKEFYDNLWTTIKSGKEWVGEFLNKKKNGEGNKK